MAKPSGQCSGGRYREDYPDGTFSGCGRWLTVEDFEAHRVQREGVEGYARRCLTDDELLDLGWIQYPDQSWASPRRIEQARQVAQRMGHGEQTPTVVRVGRSRGSVASSPGTTGVSQ